MFARHGHAARPRHQPRQAELLLLLVLPPWQRVECFTFWFRSSGLQGGGAQWWWSSSLPVLLQWGWSVDSCFLPCTGLASVCGQSARQAGVVLQEEEALKQGAWELPQPSVGQMHGTARSVLNPHLGSKREGSFFHGGKNQALAACAQASPSPRPPSRLPGVRSLRCTAPGCPSPPLAAARERPPRRAAARAESGARASPRPSPSAWASSMDVKMAPSCGSGRLAQRSVRPARAVALSVSEGPMWGDGQSCCLPLCWGWVGARRASPLLSGCGGGSPLSWRCCGHTPACGSAAVLRPNHEDVRRTRPHARSRRRARPW